MSKELKLKKLGHISFSQGKPIGRSGGPWEPRVATILSYYRWAVLLYLQLLLFVRLFSLLMPYWLVYVLHVENRFFNTFRL
jgi:hypothetical protein